MPDYPATPGYGTERRRNPELRAAYTRLVDTLAEREARLRRRAWITEVVRNVALVACIAFVWVTSITARQELIENQRAGCARSSSSYQINAANWRDEAANWSEAARARRRDGDIAVANSYKRKADRIRARAGRLTALSGVHADATRQDIAQVCQLRYPDTGLR
jgi:hypothetical protein